MAGKISLEEYIRRANTVHNNKYDYSLSHLDFINCKSKVKIRCPIHGVFEQSFDKHVIGKHECPYCANRYRNTETFIESARKIHEDKYDYSLVKYVAAQIKVKIICPKHGVFEQTPNSHLNGCGCFSCQYEYLSQLRAMPYNDFIERAKNYHPEYDYSLVEYKNTKTKVKVICPTHGAFMITPDHLMIGKGCKRCAMENLAQSLTKTKEQFVEEAKKVHGDKYDYSLVEYKNTKAKVKIICPIHGVFEQIAQEHLKGANCPNCNISHGEEKIMMWLDSHNYILNKDYFREYMFKELGKKRFDFYIPSKNLLIEYNGKQHYTCCSFNDSPEKLKRQQQSDYIKSKFAKDKGIGLLTIPYTEFDDIEKILENKIGSL